tara:strand:- start:3061 stop:4803 length:1743 start_codon:yes stop_codon:yes gene_type:complete
MSSVQSRHKNNAEKFLRKFISSDDYLVELFDANIETDIYYFQFIPSKEESSIFIFNELRESVEKFNSIISKFNSNSSFLELDFKSVEDWFNLHTGEIFCLNLDNCKIMLSKGVSLFRIDISPVQSLDWTDITGNTNTKDIEFGHPFSSPLLKSIIPDFEFDINSSESVMILSILFQIQSGKNNSFVAIENYHSVDDFEKFISSRLFKEFVMYSVFNIFNKSIDIFESPALKKACDNLIESFSKYELIQLCNSLLTIEKSKGFEHNIEINILKPLIKNIEQRDVFFYFHLKLQRYFNIQDGEFILYMAMYNSNDDKISILSDKQKETLFIDMVNESNDDAIKIRKSLIGELPMNLVERPTSLKVQTNEKTTFDQKALDLYETAFQNINNQSFDDALNCLEKSIEIDPLILPSYIALSGLYINNYGRYKDAVKICSKIIDLDGFEKSNDKNYAQIYDNRGLAKSYLEDEEDAINDFNKSLRIDNNRPITLTSRAFSQMQIGNNSQALDDLNEAILMDDSIPNIYFNRSKCRQSLGDFQGSLEDCLIAFERDSNNTHILEHKMFLETLKESELWDVLNNPEKE